MTTHHLDTIDVGDLVDLGRYGEFQLVETGDAADPYAWERIEEHTCSEDIGFNAGCGDRAPEYVDGEWYCEMHAARRQFSED